jgi:hypothetical protein
MLRRPSAWRAVDAERCIVACSNLSWFEETGETQSAGIKRR